MTVDADPGAQARDNIIIYVFMIVIIALVVGRGLGPDMLLLDRFHEGEFFANSMEYIGNGTTQKRGLPIHGLMDILPSMLTAGIWGLNHNFVPTYAVLKLLDFTAAALLVLIAMRLARPVPNRMWLLLALCLIAPFVVGRRDVFLLLSILQFVILVQNRSGQQRRITFLLFGIIVAFGMLYSYNRGLVAIISLGLATLYLAWFERRFFIALGGFAVTLVVLHLSSELFDISWYLRNIQYLAASSPEWRYEWSGTTVFFVSFAVLLNAIALFSLWSDRNALSKQPRTMAVIIALTLLSLLMLKIGTNRAAFSHIMMTAWVPCLIVLMSAQSLQLDHNSHRARGMILCFVMAVLIALLLWLREYDGFLVILPLFFVVAVVDFQAHQRAKTIVVGTLVFLQGIYGALYVQETLAKAQYSWVARVVSPPTNAATSEPVVNWAAAEILDSGAQCLFDLSNNGLINGLALLPSCSRFTYPVYAASRYEDLLIADLVQADPPAIIFSADYWSYAIDDRSMQDRHPDLDTYLRQIFPFETCKGGYCIRRKVRELP
jgi:hypothetical protein